MWILGIETTGMAGSIALVRASETMPLDTNADKSPMWYKNLPADRRSAQTLAPAIASLLAEADCLAQQVGLVAVCAGPGSFTGLRVGVGTAKTFAYAVGAQAVGIDTLDVLAHQAPLKEGQTVWCILNAQRGELFAARYQYGIHCVEPCHIVCVESWLASLGPGEMVIGPPLEKLTNRLPKEVNVAPPELWLPHAATVAQLGYALWLAKPEDVSFSPFDLLPKYVRRVAAEEQWEQRHA
jgi:tRNA threonylcarbamoyladenosine biosynthesis protein TsaB